MNDNVDDDDRHRKRDEESDHYRQADVAVNHGRGYCQQGQAAKVGQPARENKIEKEDSGVTPECSDDTLAL